MIRYVQTYYRLPVTSCISDWSEQSRTCDTALPIQFYCNCSGIAVHLNPTLTVNFKSYAACSFDGAKERLLVIDYQDDIFITVRDIYGHRVGATRATCLSTYISRIQLSDRNQDEQQHPECKPKLRVNLFMMLICMMLICIHNFFALGRVDTTVNDTEVRPYPGLHACVVVFIANQTRFV